MKKYTIEFLFNSEIHDNKFLRLLNNEKYDINVTYAVEGSRAWIMKVESDDNYGKYDITETCKLLGAMEELTSACEFDFTGRIVKEMFDNYPQLAEPELTPHQKSELLKLK